jgi:hypothetical protein
MRHEFKIVVNWEEEDLDSDGKLFSCPTVYLDGYAVGCIQELKFHAKKDEIIPEIEVTFPDLTNENIDPVYLQPQTHVNGYWYFGGGTQFVDSIKENIELMLQTPITVKLASLDSSNPRTVSIHGIDRDIVDLQEVGTDGVIDWVPVKK